MHTGDSGYFDDDGFLFIADRIKDMIISGGENVYSIEVENAISSHPDVAQCAVIGIPDPRWGEAGACDRGCTHGRRRLTAESIIAHCRPIIAGYKCPRSVDLRRELLPQSSVKRSTRPPCASRSGGIDPVRSIDGPNSSPNQFQACRGGLTPFSA